MRNKSNITDEVSQVGLEIEERRNSDSETEHLFNLFIYKALSSVWVPITRAWLQELSGSVKNNTYNKRRTENYNKYCE